MSRSRRDTSRAGPRPPAHLGERSRRFFRGVVRRYLLEGHHVEVLTEAANALDRAESARQRVTAEGETFADRWGQLRPHPLLTVERDSRALFARLLRELGLDVERPGER